MTIESSVNFETGDVLATLNEEDLLFIKIENLDPFQFEKIIKALEVAYFYGQESAKRKAVILANSIKID